MDIQHVAVVGGGLMGAGIAQVVAQSGLDVTIVDVAQAQLDRARTRIETGLARSVERERLTPGEAAAALARLAFSTELDAAAAAGHVIETVVEDAEVKRDVLRRLDGICGDAVVFASNTSQFSISNLAAATGRPDRVIGSHWFNPAPVMRMIELVRGLETSDATLATAEALAARYGKETVVCRRDTQGFITTRLSAVFCLEAMRLVEEGIADPEDIDRACRLAFNHAMGPLATADLGGLDTTLRATSALAEQYGDRFLPPQGLRTLVAAGHHGRKTGRGYHRYES